MAAILANISNISIGLFSDPTPMWISHAQAKQALPRLPQPCAKCWVRYKDSQPVAPISNVLCHQCEMHDQDTEDEIITNNMKNIIYRLSILSWKAPNPKCGQITNTAGTRYLKCIYLFLFYVYGYFARTYVCIQCPKNQKREPDSPELEL